MLFMVISTPAPSRPSEARDRRQAYWDWADRQKDSGLMLEAWARAGRGAVALFDVDSNETLHRLINEWSEIVPAEYMVLPLLDTVAIRGYLDEGQSN